MMHHPVKSIRRIVFAFILIGACIIAGIWFMRQPTSLQKPDDTNLEFWITQNVEGINFSRHIEIDGWFGAKQYYGAGYQPIIDDMGPCDTDHYVKYLITAYPDYADGGQYITKIEISDPNITFYGLTTNSSFEEFDRTLQKQGYEISSPKLYPNVPHPYIHTASKNGITFTLNKMIVPNIITINAEISNREGIVF